MMSRRNNRVAALVAFAATATAFTSACSSSGGSGTTAPPPRATGNPVSAQPTSLGTILVNDTGRTVYIFANDKPNQSSCDGACAANWPPVTAPTTLPPSPPGVTGTLGTTTRSDGRHQLTVSGHPVYTFTGDTAPGQTTGQGITLNGGLWTTVLPSGAPDASPAKPTSAPAY